MSGSFDITWKPHSVIVYLSMFRVTASKSNMFQHRTSYGQKIHITKVVSKLIYGNNNFRTLNLSQRRPLPGYDIRAIMLPILILARRN